MVREPPSTSAEASRRCHSSQLIAKSIEVATRRMLFTARRWRSRRGDDRGIPRSASTAGSRWEWRRWAVARESTAERTSGATGCADGRESDGGPRGPAAVSSSLDHSCGGSGSYRSAVVAPRRRGSRSSRRRFTSLEWRITFWRHEI